MKMDKKLNFQKDITEPVRKLKWMAFVICKITAGMRRSTGKTSYSLLLCLTLIVVVQEHGRSVNAQVEARYCFSTFGNALINTGQYDEHILQLRGYTGFGHDEYQISGMGFPGLWQFPYNALHSGRYKLELYTVKPTNEQHPLFGWFHFKVVNEASYIVMKAATIQAEIVDLTNIHEPAVMTGVGEYMTSQLGSGGSDCNSNLGPDIGRGCRTNIAAGRVTIPPDDQLGKRNRINCQFSQSPYHLVGSGFAFKTSGEASNFESNWKAYFPVCAVWSPTEYPLLFRTASYMNEPSGAPGSNPQDTIARLNSPRIFFQEYVYGAPDPAPPKNTAMDCCTPIVPGTNNPTVPWVARVADPSWVHICKPAAKCFVCDGGRKLYYGRCSEDSHQMVCQIKDGQIADLPDPPPYPYTCRNTNAFTKSLPTYTQTILQPFHDQLENCTIECSKSVHRVEFLGISANSAIGKEVWGLRKAHGIALAFATLLFIPWNNFNARYMKETYMDEKLAHMPVWYMTHIHLSLNILAFLSAGFMAGVWARTFFGYSLTILGRLHVAMGWLSALIFGVTLLSSGIRIRWRYSRLCGIFLHFLGGTIHYALCMLCLLTSGSIAGSPAGSASSDDARKASSFKVVPVVGITFGWIIFDIVINILMMASLKMSDSKMKLAGKRTFAFGIVPIPLRDLHSTVDIPGGSFRKFIYVVYVLVGAALSVMVSYSIYFSPTKGRSFGRTNHIHTANGKLQQVWKFAGYSY